MIADELEGYAERIRVEGCGEDESLLITFEMDEALYRIETHDLNAAFRLFDICLIEGSHGLYAPKKPENPIAIAHDERKVILIGLVSGIDLRTARAVVEAVKLFRYGGEFYLQYLARSAENAARVLECLAGTSEVGDQILDVEWRSVPCPPITVYNHQNLLLELLRAFGSHVPPFDLSQVVFSVEVKEEDFDEREEICEDVLREVVPMMLREYGTDVRYKIERTDHLLRYLLPNQIYYANLEITLPEFFVERLTDTAFRGMLYWTLALGIHNHRSFETLRCPDVEAVFRDSYTLDPEQIQRETHRRYTETDAIVVHEFGQSALLVSFITEWYHLAVKAEHPVMSEEEFHLYLDVLAEHCPEEAGRIRSETIGHKA